MASARSESLALTVLSSVGAGCILAILFVVGYRLTLHPLARYPGPFLAKLTDMYSTYHAWKGDRHMDFHRLHTKYGEYVRFGPNSISINTATGLKGIYGYGKNVQKAKFYTAYPPTPQAVNTHNVIDKAANARKRRVLAPAFSDAALRAMEELMLGHIRTFCNILGSSATSVTDAKSAKSISPGEWTPAKNIADWCNYLTFDVMGDLAFGKAFDMLTTTDNHFVLDLVSATAVRHYICANMLLLHNHGLDKYLFPHASAGRDRYLAWTKANTTERMKRGPDTDRKDFFSYFLSARDPETGTGFSPLELWGEANLMIVAGSDTTSTALAATFFYLLHNPAALDRVTTEVRAAFPDPAEVRSGPTLNACSYLRACIDEALRMCPPVGTLAPREVLEGGLAIDGHTFPQGTIVGTCHYALHHNPTYFPEPFTYRPERWLSSEVGDEAVERAKAAFCAFSVGPRACIGRGMAYMELGDAVARVVREFDLRLKEGNYLGEGGAGMGVGRERGGEYQTVDRFTSWQTGPVVELRRVA